MQQTGLCWTAEYVSLFRQLRSIERSVVDASYFQAHPSKLQPITNVQGNVLKSCTIRSALESFATVSSIFCLAASAQQQPARPGVSVLLTDPSGAAIANAPVRIFNADNTTGAPVWNVRTDATGHVNIALPAGSYLLQSEAPGFSTLQQSIVLADNAAPLSLVFRLSVAAGADQVDVRSEDLVDSTGNGEALVLKGKTLSTLSDDPSTFQQQLQSLVGGGDEQPQFRIDGFTGGRFPPKDSIREVRINQNGYSAQFDQRGNSVIDIFTKPGSDKLHGNLFAVGNANPFNARSPYITAQPGYHTVFIDGNINGPLGKKTSFFAGGNRNDFENNAAVNAVTLDSTFNAAPFAQAISNPLVTNSVNFRIDRQLTTNNTFTGRYEFADTHQSNSGVGQLVLSSQGINTDTKTNTLQIGNTTIFSPRIVGETRFQYLRTRMTQSSVSTAPTLIVQGSFNGGGSPSQASQDKQDRYEFQEYVSIDRGKHFIRAGARYRLTRDSNLSTANYNGQYIFPTLAAYQITLRGQAASQTPAQIRAAGGGASQFNLTAGSPSANILTGDLGLYIEDEWKIRPHFSLIPGLRYETQSAIPDGTDPAPRLGFSWDITTSKRKSPLFTLRGGFGLFYDRFAATNILTAARQNGITQSSYYIQNPDFYPAVPAPANLNSVQPTVYRVAPNLRSEYYVSEGITAARNMGQRGNISVTYNHLQGSHLFLSRNANSPVNGVRPLGGTQNVYEYASLGHTVINSVWANAYIQIGKHAGSWTSYGLRFQQSDTSGASNFVSNSYDVHADYGRPADVARSRLSTGAWWDIGRGFNTGMFLSAHTASRFNISTGTDVNGDSIYNDRPAFATDLTRASVVRTAYGNFDTAPVTGQRIVPINYGRAPGLFTLNMRLGKGFGFGKLPTPAPPAPGSKPDSHPDKPERPYQVNFSVFAQNVLNNVNPGRPIGQLSSPFFGRSLTLNTEQSESTAANRQISVFTNFRF